MKIRLTRVMRSRKGHPIRAQSTIESEAPMIGRGAQCAIHLSDPRVAFEHASVFVSDGARRVTGVGGAMLMVDGHAAGDIVLAPGSHFEVGPYVVTVEEPPEGFDLAIAVELVRPLPDSLSEITAKSRFSLDAGGLSKRSMAWTGLFVVLALFLLIPIVNPTLPFLGFRTAPVKDAAKGQEPGRLKTLPKEREDARGKVYADAVWNAGPLSEKHQPFAYDCAACHQTPFLRVRDNACNACHDLIHKIEAHIRDPLIQTRLFGAKRCTECHAEHRGGIAPTTRDSGLCVSCHADILHVFTESTLANVPDFSRHPEFRLTLPNGPKPADVIRVKQSDKANLVERSNLEFSHQKHLKPGLKGPDGRETLKCGSCHAAELSKTTFAPVTMQQHCIRCHELTFEPADLDGKAPHGDVKQAWLKIQDFYAKISLRDIPVNQAETGPVAMAIPKPSEAIMTEEERRKRAKTALKNAQFVAIDLFEKRACRLCHKDVRRVSNGLPAEGNTVPWIVPAVHVASAWMPKARFDHDSHGKQDDQCKSCHRVDRSERSSDVSMPEIGTCRTSGCHGDPGVGAVASTCNTCHAFHLDEALPRLRPVAISPGTKQ